MQQTVEEQYGFLRRFAQQIERGEQPLDGRALVRTEAYIRSARTAHFRARGEVAQSVGYDQVRTVLAIADHCKGDGERPGCPEEAAREWVPIGQLSLPGERVCRQNCRCSLRYRNSRTGEEWGAAEAEELLGVA